MYVFKLTILYLNSISVYSIYNDLFVTWFASVGLNAAQLTAISCGSMWSAFATNSASAALTWLKAQKLKKKELVAISRNGMWSAFAENRHQNAVRLIEESGYFRAGRYPRPNYCRMGKICQKNAQPLVAFLLTQPKAIMLEFLEDTDLWIKSGLRRVKEMMD
jgi:hypothetical protein